LRVADGDTIHKEIYSISAARDDLTYRGQHGGPFPTVVAKQS